MAVVVFRRKIHGQDARKNSQGFRITANHLMDRYITIRCGSEYTFIRSPRMKPASVCELSFAKSTANDEGADTDPTTGTRPANAFCMISNEVRPLTIRTCLSNGSKP
jgi:hypothetical protein